MDNVPVDKLGGWREHWHVYLIGRKPMEANNKKIITEDVQKKTD